MRQGSWAYPESVDAEAVRHLADSLASTSTTLDHLDDRFDNVAVSARTSWQGAAADTFGHHMNDRGHAFELTAVQVRQAVAALRAFADAIDRSKRAYERAVAAEESGRARESEEDVNAAVYMEGEAVGVMTLSGISCATKLATITTLIDDYTRRSFVPVGQHLGQSTFATSPFGRDLVVDSLLATEDGRIGSDEIQVRRLSDGSYIVVLPGVTDLTTSLTSGRPGRWWSGSPEDTVRQVANAQPSVREDGPNAYADAVKMALQRAGVPAGSTVSFVGHSYGDYTAVDLAGDDSFNSADGDANGYHLNVRNVYGFGGDVDWKLPKVPPQTNAVILNSRDDVVYRGESVFHADLLGVGDTLPASPSIPNPFSYQTRTANPTGNWNQLEVEVNGGVQWSADDGFVSGHHPRNYARSIPNAGPEADALFNSLGTRTVVESYNIRVPNAPSDTVPPVPAAP